MIMHVQIAVDGYVYKLCLKWMDVLTKMLKWLRVDCELTLCWYLHSEL